MEGAGLDETGMGRMRENKISALIRLTGKKTESGRNENRHEVRERCVGDGVSRQIRFNFGFEIE